MPPYTPSTGTRIFIDLSLPSLLRQQPMEMIITKTVVIKPPSTATVARVDRGDAGRNESAETSAIGAGCHRRVIYCVRWPSSADGTNRSTAPHFAKQRRITQQQPFPDLHPTFVRSGDNTGRGGGASAIVTISPSSSKSTAMDLVDFRRFLRRRRCHSRGGACEPP